MKRYIYIAVTLLLQVSACTAPWEDYSPPVPREVATPEEPEEPKEPEEPTKPTNKDTIVVKVMSFGINGANAKPAGMAVLIKEQKPDFVVLREVDSYNLRSGKEIDQGEEIAKLTGMNYFFAKGFDYREGAYGAGVLSRFPIEDARAVILAVDPTPGGLGGETRPFAMIRVKVQDDFEMVFVGTHTDDGSNVSRRAVNRPLQANQILDIIKDVEVPVIVAGNFYFQSQADDPMLRILYEQLIPGCTDCALTYPADKPGFVSDHIMYKTNDKADAKVLSYTIGGTAINNRVPVFSEIQLVKKK